MADLDLFNIGDIFMMLLGAGIGIVTFYIIMKMAGSWRNDRRRHP